MILSPSPVQQFFGNNGRPLDGGLLFTYVAGTTTKIATYTDSTGNTANTNPIVLDFRGECNLWLDPELTYKFVLSPRGDTDPPTSPIWTVDDISGLGGLTQQIIGKLLWPKTADEIAAGVPIANYAYPPLNVRRYGAVLDGVTNDTSAFTYAFQVANVSGGGEVTYDGNAVCKNLPILDNVTLRAMGHFAIIGAPTASSDYILTATGTAGTSISLNANAAQGAATVSVASASGLSIDDYVLVGEETYVTGTDGRSQQITKIVDISGGTITLRDTLFQPYLTANSANIQKITPIRFSLIDVVLENPQPTTGANNGGCMNLYLATEVTLKNVELSGASRSAAFKTYTCSNIRGNLWIHDCPGGTVGSSIGLGAYINNSHDMRLYTRLERVNQCSLEFVSRFCDISFDADNMVDSAWNTHGNGNTDCQFHDFTINGSQSVGMAVGFGSQTTSDHRIAIRNGKIQNTISHGISMSGKSGNTNTGCVIENVEIRGFKASGSSSTYGITGSYNDDLRISNCVIDGTTVTNAVDGAYNFSNCARTKIDDSRASNVPSGYGIQFTSCTDWVVDSVRISNAANYVNTVTSTATYTGACRITNCVADVLAPTRVIEAAAFQMGNSWNYGTYTGTLTGMTGSVTLTVNYTRNGYQVQISYAGASGTSNTTAMTMTGLPAELNPAIQQRIYAQTVQDNGANVLGRVTVETSGTFTYATDFNGAAFTAANGKGAARCTFSYSLI